MELINNLCDVFNFFGKFYPIVTIENIEKKNLPVFYSGSDYEIITPKDTDCDFNYFRILSEKPIYIDVGGCSKIHARNEYVARWVYYSKQKKDVSKILIKFNQLFPKGYGLQIQKIERESNKTLLLETNVKIDVKLKNITYFCIDFSFKEQIKSDCETNNTDCI
jgi:hypothetical protein